MNKKQCRIGIIGAGRIGKIHAENIKQHLPFFDLQIIADPHLDEQWAASLAIPQCSTKEEEVLFHSELDAVIIASPSSFHLPHINAASETGKAIFCEKPLGFSEEDIVATLERVKHNNTLLQLGFNRRFDPCFSRLQQQVAEGVIGQPQIIKITSRDPACPTNEYLATSGGLFMDMSIHDFDMARFLAQSEVIEVYAQGAVLINPACATYNDVDTAIIQLRFANGALAVIDNSRQAVYGYDQRIEVFGSKGMLLAQNQLEHGLKYYTAEQTSEANPQYFFLERYQAAYRAELMAFYNAWANALPSPVSGMDALQALRLAQAAKNSLVQQTVQRLV